MRDKKLTKDEVVQLLKSNMEEIVRLGNLAEGLLALSQTDSTDMLEPLSLEEIVAKVIKRLQPLASAKKITIKSHLQPAIVLGEQQAVDKIASILLDNAIKYSGEDTTISIKTYHREGRGVLEVADQGIGIKATELPHIFDRFYRADSSRSKTHVAGHGLGLSIAQKLAENVNAKLTAASSPSKGSTFTLQLRAQEKS